MNEREGDEEFLCAGDDEEEVLSQCDSITSISSDPNSVQSGLKITDHTLMSSTEVANIWCTSILMENGKSSVEQTEASCSEGLQELLEIDLNQHEMELHSLPVTSGLLEDEGQSSRVRKVYPFQRAIMVHPPPDFMVWAVFATLFCFLPTGIMAIARSAEIGKLYRKGMIQEARVVSRKVQFWIRLSVYIGAGLYIFSGLILCIAFLSHFKRNSEV